jgi:hypothetical protein
MTEDRRQLTVSLLVIGYVLFGRSEQQSVVALRYTLRALRIESGAEAPQ